jgi:hypothetical protein
MSKKQKNLSEGVPRPDDISIQKIEDLGERPEGTRQSRRLGNFLKSSDFDNLDQENPFVKMESNPAVSEKQQKFMAMCAHNPSKARGDCPSTAVAKEFSHRG